MLGEEKQEIEVAAWCWRWKGKGFRPGGPWQTLVCADMARWHTRVNPLPPLSCIMYINVRWTICQPFSRSWYSASELCVDPSNLFDPQKHRSMLKDSCGQPVSGNLISFYVLRLSDSFRNHESNICINERSLYICFLWTDMMKHNLLSQCQEANLKLICVQCSLMLQQTEKTQIICTSKWNCMVPFNTLTYLSISIFYCPGP